MGRCLAEVPGREEPLAAELSAALSLAFVSSVSSRGSKDPDRVVEQTFWKRAVPSDTAWHGAGSGLCPTLAVIRCSDLSPCVLRLPVGVIRGSIDHSLGWWTAPFFGRRSAPITGLPSTAKGKSSCASLPRARPAPARGQGPALPSRRPALLAPLDRPPHKALILSPGDA